MIERHADLFFKWLRFPCTVFDGETLLKPLHMAKESSGRSDSSKRETIAPNGDKRYVRRDEDGRFSESDDVSRSLSQDRKRTAKNDTKPGHGDKGDRKASSTKSGGQ